MLALGGGLLAYVPLLLHSATWLRVEIAGHSIAYRFSSLPVLHRILQGAWQVLYLLVICTPLTITRDRRFTIFSALLLLAAAISGLNFWYAYVSVWCFSSALLSAYLCYLFSALPAKRRVVQPLLAPV